MINIELKIPPPIIALISATLMWHISKITNVYSYSPDLLAPYSIALLILGLSIDITALISFRLSQTTINPMKPSNTSQLVNTGIYKLSRNPMYLGLFCTLCAWAMWLGDALNLAVLFIFIYYITHFQIIPEEKILEKIFPEEFESYKSKVRRWL